VELLSGRISYDGGFHLRVLFSEGVFSNRGSSPRLLKRKLSSSISSSTKLHLNEFFSYKKLEADPLFQANSKLVLQNVENDRYFFCSGIKSIFLFQFFLFPSLASFPLTCQLLNYERNVLNEFICNYVLHR